MNRVLTRMVIGAGLIAGLGGLLMADVTLTRWAGLAVAPLFWLLLLAALLLGAWEYFRMIRAKGFPCRPVIGIVGVGLLVAAVFGETQFPPRLRTWLWGRGLELYLVLIVALVFATFIAQIRRVERRGETPARAMAGVGWTLVGILTIGLLGVFLAKIRFLGRGLGGSGSTADELMYLVLTLGVVKGADIGAWAVGTAVGRHKLVPTLSPGKTVEGLIGAFAFGMAAAVGIGLAWGRFTWPEMLVFGGLVAFSGVLGDLAESLIKRTCGVKDSGPIPTFGGAMDILDSMLASAPVAYLLLVAMS